MASAKLSVSTSSSGTRTKWTISFWVKRSNLSNENCVVGSYLDNNNKDKIAFHTDGKLSWGSFQAGSYTNMGNLVTNRVFRDVNAWYHIVCRWDTGNSTANDRMKIWVNGVEETSFGTRLNPELNRVSLINYTTYTTIGNNGASGNYFDGSLSHVHFCDNYAYSASDFGETDTTTGIWKPKTAPSVNYGTNGFFLKFDNSANMGLDSSGNSNNLTTSGTIIQNKDTPSNVFATMNPLMDALSPHTFSNGNNTVQSPNSTHSYVNSTLGFSKGKYYFETKCEAKSGGSDWFMVGITAKFPTADNAEIGNYVTDHGYRGDNGNVRNNNSESSYGSTFGVGDIIGCAVDMDNGKLYFHKNGTYQNSGDPTSGSTGTGAINISSASSPPTGDNATGFYFPSVAFWDSTYNGTLSVNFGNGYFGTTAVSSAQNPDDGIGIFEYDVPAGYRALCTKSLNAEEYS